MIQAFDSLRITTARVVVRREISRIQPPISASPAAPIVRAVFFLEVRSTAPLAKLDFSSTMIRA